MESRNIWFFAALVKYVEQERHKLNYSRDYIPSCGLLQDYTQSDSDFAKLVEKTADRERRVVHNKHVYGMLIISITRCDADYYASDDHDYYDDHFVG